MEKKSIDKRKNKPLNKETREKYKAMVKTCESTKEHFKRLMAERELMNVQCRAVVEHYEDRLNNLEAPGKSSRNPDPEVKKAMDELRQEVELAQVMIRDHKADIICNKEIIKVARQQAMVYWRHEKRYKALLAATRTRKKKV